MYYLCVLDFEATCNEDNSFSRNQMEIIEFPSILFSIENYKITQQSIFHQYVKPVNTPINKFCENLTGITPTIVENCQTIEMVLKDHLNWLKENTHQRLDLVYFVTCGDWDLRTALPNEIKNKQIKDVNTVYQRYINLKNEFSYFYQTKAIGMTGMLAYLKIKMEGRHHSGIDDTKNISKILIKMVNDGHTDFEIKKLI